MTVSFVPTGQPLGAFVEGAALGGVALGGVALGGDESPSERLTAELTKELTDRLISGLEQHRVLIFRGSPIPAANFVALGLAFGELEILPEPDKRHPDHPEIFNLSNVRPDGQVVTYDEPQSVFLRGTERWHTDSSFRKVPCLCTMLNAITVPPQGGETEFADMVAAFEALDPLRQVELSKLTVVHSYEYSRANNPGEMDPMSEQERAKYPPVGHPLVRVQPDGSRSLYMGGHASHIEGMDEQQGRELLAELVEFATEDRFVYRHRWQANDLVVWDNRSTLHRLRPYDIANQARVMQRITVAGREPVVAG